MRRLFLNIFLIITTINFALAQEVIDTIHVADVVVTATRTPRQLKETPILTKLITEKDIQKYGRAKLEDILTSELAGIEFHQSGYGLSLSYQGLDARHILILIDGERMAGEINGNIDFSRINPLSVEKIEVMKGSASVLYGSSAMGATINIITKQAKEEGAGSVQFKVAPYFQKNDSSEGNNSDIPNIDAAAIYSKKWGNLSSVTDVKLQSTDPYRLVSTQMQKRTYSYVDTESSTVAVPASGEIYVPIDEDGISVSGWKMLGVNQKLRYDFSDRLRLDIKGGYYIRERYDLNDYDADESELDTYYTYQGVNLESILDYKVSDRSQLILSVNHNTSSQDEYSLGVTTPKQNHILSTPRLSYIFSHKKGQLMTGVEFTNEQLRYDLTDGGFDVTRKTASMSIFAQEEYKITSNLEFSAGLRALYLGFYDDESDIILTPKLALTYIKGQITYRANWAMGYRNPTLKEKYIEYYQPYMCSWIIGNEDLKAEHNNFYSLSAEYFSKSRKFTFSLMGYKNVFTDKIDTYFDDTINSYVYANTESSEITGVEVNGRVIVLHNWWLGGHYAYNYNKETAPTNSAQYIFTSPHTANINTSYLKVKGDWRYDFNLVAKYIGAKDYEDRMPTIITYENSANVGLIYGIYNAYSEGYCIVDGSVSAMFKNKYKLMFGVDNILDYTATVATFNAAMTNGRSCNLTFTFNF